MFERLAVRDAVGHLQQCRREETFETSIHNSAFLDDLQMTTLIAISV